MKLYKLHASKLSNANACLQSDLKLRRRTNSHSVETLSADTTCNVPEPWDKPKCAKIKTKLSLRTIDIDKLLFIWLTIHPNKLNLLILEIEL